MTGPFPGARGNSAGARQIAGPQRLEPSRQRLNAIVLLLLLSFDSATAFAESAFATRVCVPAFGLPVQLTLAVPPAAIPGVETRHTCAPSSLNCVWLAPAAAVPVFDTVAAYT